MYKELIERLKKQNVIFKEMQEVIKNAGAYGPEAILKLREDDPQQYNKYLDLIAEYHRADESVWEERDDLFACGIEYRKQPSRSEVWDIDN